MKNGIVPINLFEALDIIRERHGIKDGQWAANVVSKEPFYQSRISELRRLSRLTRLGIPTTKKVGRAFSVSKFIMLTESLKQILGEKAMRKELLAVLDKVENKKERMILLILLLPERTEDQILLYLESVLKSLE